MCRFKGVFTYFRDKPTRMRTSFILLLLACLSFPPSLQAQFTLEQVLGAPYTESLLGSNDGKRLACAVNEKGVRNIWHTSLEAATPTPLTNYDMDNGLGIALQAVTPEYLFYLSALTSPVLLISGDDDRNVVIGQSIDLKNQLDARGVYNEHLVFPDEVHGFLRYDSWLRAFQATEGFFNRYLK